MAGSPFFVQRCPSCCRALCIDVHYLGLEVECQHCRKTFTAHDPATESPALRSPIDDWIEAADHALQASAPTGLNRIRG